MMKYLCISNGIWRYLISHVTVPIIVFAESVILNLVIRFKTTQLVWVDRNKILQKTEIVQTNYNVDRALSQSHRAYNH